MLEKNDSDCKVVFTKEGTKTQAKKRKNNSLNQFKTKMLGVIPRETQKKGGNKMVI